MTLLQLFHQLYVSVLGLLRCDTFVDQLLPRVVLGFTLKIECARLRNRLEGRILASLLEEAVELCDQQSD